MPRSGMVHTPSAKPLSYLAFLPKFAIDKFDMIRIIIIRIIIIRIIMIMIIIII